MQIFEKPCSKVYLKHEIFDQNLHPHSNCFITTLVVVVGDGFVFFSIHRLDISNIKIQISFLCTHLRCEQNAVAKFSVYSFSLMRFYLEKHVAKNEIHHTLFIQFTLDLSSRRDGS